MTRPNDELSAHDLTRTLGVSREAADLYLTSDVIDLHVDSFIWTRIFGYDVRKLHRAIPFGGAFMGQVDLPRLRQAHVTGALWSITTNPLRPARQRTRTFEANAQALVAQLESPSAQTAIVETANDYTRAKQAGKHAAWIAVQGGNALEDKVLDVSPLVRAKVIAVTLIHFAKSRIGSSSAPHPREKLPWTHTDKGLLPYGRDFVRALNQARIFVDLAHISRDGFDDAVKVHDKTQPLLVTHTGVDAVHPHWRNVTDAQIRKVADTGGTLGVIYQSGFLENHIFRGRAERIVDHMEHIIRVSSEDHVSLGSDWDGMIIAPVEMRTCLELPRIVELMLARKWTPVRIEKVLGGNYLRALRQLRGDA